jgi:Fe-S-cluster containining protein
LTTPASHHIRLEYKPDWSYKEDVPELKLRIHAPDRFLDANVHLPDQPLRPFELLPILYGLTDAVVSMSEARVTESGEAITCRAGCGACCRQLVPVSEAEAVHLAGVVAAMPEQRRTQIAERFREARERSAAVLEALHATSGEAHLAEIGQAAEAYFALGIPCPFLEDESCGIHPDRPATCREYLVTSSPEHCARLDATQVRLVDVPARISSTLLCFQDGKGAAAPSVMPLIDALDWAAGEHNHPQPALPAPEMFRNFMQKFLNGPKPD